MAPDTFHPSYFCAKHRTTTPDSDHCLECEQDTRGPVAEPFARGDSRQITYVDDGIEIRLSLPLKPGAVKFAQGFLWQLLHDTDNT